MDQRQSGLALLIVVGVLGILAVLATAFVTMAQLERRASLQRLHATKAALLARSGIEDALARLSAGQIPAYGGEDWDGNGNPAPDPGVETGAQVFQPTVMNGADCPVAQALRPSFFARAPGSAFPATKGVDGRQRGFSGGLFAEGSFVLKVEDESAKINVNGGFLDTLDRDDGGAGDGIPDHRDGNVTSVPSPGLPPQAATGLGWNFQLTRILNTLGNQPEVRIPALGTKILANRPPGGYRAIAQLQDALNTPKDLSPWLTVSSWIDTKVLHPNAWNQPAHDSMSMTEVKLGRAPLFLEEGGRPPVNLNAASRPVLVALVTGLGGESWQEVTSNFRRRYIPTADAGRTVAAIVDALISFRQGQDPDRTFRRAGIMPGPFTGWSQFSAFCDALVGPVIDVDVWPQKGGNPAVADLLKANFDPSGTLNKQLPDQILWRWIDKSDLTTWSTEGSLGPTGIHRVSCAGRLLGKDGRLLAEHLLSATVEAFRLLRQSTQEDFVGDRAGGDLRGYLSLETAPWEKTAGASAGDAFWGAPSPGTGLAVMSYPCSVPAIQAGKASAFEGCLGLATVEAEEGDPPDGTLLFLHHFDDGWNADRGAATMLVSSDVYNARLVRDPAEAVWPASGEPGTFYPDGVHVQAERCPAFQAKDNLPPPLMDSGIFLGNHGVLSYWFKQAARQAGGGNDHITCYRAGQERSQVLAAGFGNAGWSIWLGGALMEHSLNEDPLEHGDGTERNALFAHEDRRCPLPGMRWCLGTLLWNTSTSDMGMDLLYTARGIPPYVPLPDTLYDTPFPGGAEDLAPDPGVLLALGGPRSGTVTGNWVHRGQSMNLLMDEFASYDFGPAAAPVLSLRSAVWADTRYKAGRYHKGNAGRLGCFLSMPLAPEEGLSVRVLRASWTAYLPGEARWESSEKNGAYKDVKRAINPDLADTPAGPRLWVEVDLLDPAGTLTGPALQPLSQGGRVDRGLPAFRYRVAFRSDIPDNEFMDKPLLETPFFDDITFAWQSMTGPRTLAWSTP